MISGISRSYLVGPLIYLVATLMVLVSPIASVVLFGIITIFYIIESSVFGRSS